MRKPVGTGISAHSVPRHLNAPQNEAGRSLLYPGQPIKYRFIKNISTDLNNQNLFHAIRFNNRNLIEVDQPDIIGYNLIEIYLLGAGWVTNGRRSGLRP